MNLVVAGIGSSQVRVRLLKPLTEPVSAVLKLDAVNKTNLEAANSRIIGVDVADESTKLARYNILQQVGTAMLAQANQSTQSILRLIS